MNENKVVKSDVVIVGGGVIGCSTAFYLSKLGLKVAVVDRDQIANGASVRNGAMNKINRRGLGELDISMYGENEVWPRLSEDIGYDVEYKQTGGYRFCMENADYELSLKFQEYGEKLGMHFENMTNAELKKRIPGISDKVLYAIRCKEESRANPLKVTLGFYSAALKLGAEFYPGEEIEYLEVQKGKIYSAVSVNGTKFVADKIMVSSGYNSRKILNTVGIDLYMFSFYEEIFVTEKLPHFMDEIFVGRFYGQQTKNGSVLFGASDGFAYFPNRNLYPYTYQTPKAIPSLARGLMDLFPFLSRVKIVRSWGGWMDISPDDSMIIGPVDTVPGLYVACGFSGHGFGISAPTGKVMSEIISENTVGADTHHLKYNRFENYGDVFTGESRNDLINMSFYKGIWS